MKNLTLFVLVISMVCSSCATILSGTKQSIGVFSKPTAATIKVDGKEIGKTPKKFELRRMGKTADDPADKKSYKLVLELEGYLPYEVEIKRKFNALFLGNLIFGGIVGIVVDLATGAVYTLSPEKIIAYMDEGTTTFNMEKDGVLVAVTLTPEEGWEQIGQMKTVK